jgi:hypothetical protein
METDISKIFKDKLKTKKLRTWFLSFDATAMLYVNKNGSYVLKLDLFPSAAS